MARIEFARFEVWYKVDLFSDRKLWKSIDAGKGEFFRSSLGQAQRAGNSVAVGRPEMFVSIDYIELNDEGRVELSWVRSLESGEWIALDKKTVEAMLGKEG